MGKNIDFFCDKIEIETFTDCNQVKVSCTSVSVSSFLEFIEDNGEEIVKMIPSDKMEDFLAEMSKEELLEFGLKRK